MNTLNNPIIKNNNALKTRIMNIQVIAHLALLLTAFFWGPYFSFQGIRRSSFCSWSLSNHHRFCFYRKQIKVKAIVLYPNDITV